MSLRLDQLAPRFNVPAFALHFGIWVTLCLCANVIAYAETTDPWLKTRAEKLKPVSEKQKQLIADAIPDDLTAKPKAARKILCFSRCGGFVHNSIPQGIEMLSAISKKTNAFEVDFAETYDVFTKENLDQYDAIVLNNTTKMQFTEPSQQTAFMDFVAGGKGLIGFHAASDNFRRHPDCLALVGGVFAGHPWNAGGTWAFKLDDPEHVLNAAFDGKGFWHQDEIYQYKPESYAGTETLRILVSLDMNQKEVSGRIDDGPREVPVSWVRTAGDGRVFYTNFGHRQETFFNPTIVRHMLDGIQYALGDLDADATPTAKVSATLKPSLAPGKPK